MAPQLNTYKHFSQQVVKKSFLKPEQNVKKLTNYGGECGEKSVDNITFGQDAAQTLALNALAWVLGSDDLLHSFLTTTGAYPKDLPQLAQTPLFLGAVLDFLMEDDQRVINFCATGPYPLTSVQAARMALPGAQYTHWT